MPTELPESAVPDEDLMLLGVPPQLASWDRTGRPSQARLEKFLVEAANTCRTRLDLLTDPLALRLDVGLPTTTPLLEQHDLDNYLFPLATRLSKISSRQFISVWGTKRYAEASYVGVAHAAPVSMIPGSYQPLEIRTTASIGSTRFKEQIDEQLAGAQALPDGPVSLHLHFGVGPARSWLNLWKPAIDALGRILGRVTPNRPWHPRDGRIIELGLSHYVEPALGHDVIITVMASLANGP